MANIMYDYNKTRLMYGLRKLAQAQQKKEEKEQAAPAPAASQKPSIAIEPSPTLTIAPSEKPTPAPAPNYSFTQQQRAAARKRRALITAVAGTVGFGTGYLAHQLISDDPTLTGGLLTGGVVGAITGGAGYALSDPQTYLKAKADNEFKKNNPDAGKDKGKDDGKDPSWGDRIDSFVDWIWTNPWQAAGGGLGLAAFLGTMGQFGRHGLAAIPETAQKFKDLFSRNKGGEAGGGAPQNPAATARKRREQVDDVIKLLQSDDPKKRSQGRLYMEQLTDAQKKQVNTRRGQQPAAGNTPGNNGATPAGNTPGNNSANQGKPGNNGAAPAGDTANAPKAQLPAPAAAPTGDTSGAPKVQTPATGDTSGAPKVQSQQQKARKAYQRGLHTDRDRWKEHEQKLRELYPNKRERALAMLMDRMNVPGLTNEQVAEAQFKAARDAGFTTDQIYAHMAKRRRVNHPYNPNRVIRIVPRSLRIKLPDTTKNKH